MCVLCFLFCFNNFKKSNPATKNHTVLHRAALSGRPERGLDSARGKGGVFSVLHYPLGPLGSRLSGTTGSRFQRVGTF